MEEARGGRRPERMGRMEEASKDGEDRGGQGRMGRTEAAREDGEDGGGQGG